MLGWFKKKFKKKAPPPPEETAIEELTTDTSFSEHQQAEKEQDTVIESIAHEEPPPAVPETIEEESPVYEPPLPEGDVPETDEVPTVTDEPAVGVEQPAEKFFEAAVEEPKEEPVSADTLSEDHEAKEPETETNRESEPAAEPQIIDEEPDEQVIHEDTTPHPIPEVIPPVSQQTEKKKEKKSLFSRLSDKLSKTRETFTYQLDALFLGKKVIDEEMLDDLEELLITADLGVSTTHELLEYARREVKRKELSDPESLKKILKKRITKLILDNEADATLVMPEKGPFVIMVIGVNGVGKTTTIGKIANKFIKSGQSVLLVAADTFRAAAVSQLKIWGERNSVEVVAHKDGADPSSVVFDGLGIAVTQNVDVVLVDTAGRLHTQDNLMEELKKIKRVMHKKLPGAPHETMLVIDATTGQNGISQARLFDAAVDITGLTLTKLDGTSKGGIVANICKEMKIPIRFIGVGEQMEDLRDFDASEFAEALFQSSYGKHKQ